MGIDSSLHSGKETGSFTSIDFCHQNEDHCPQNKKPPEESRGLKSLYRKAELVKNILIYPMPSPFVLFFFGP